MSLRGAMCALSMLSAALLASTGAFASPTDPSAQAAAPGLAHGILQQINAAMPTCGPKDTADAAISRATNGADLSAIVAALQLLRRGDVAVVAGSDPAAQARAREILSCAGVQQALAEASEIANLALNTYGATGGVPTGGAPGQAFGTSGVGAPGGGGGSGYTP